jgi:hypothetical protein
MFTSIILKKMSFSSHLELMVSNDTIGCIVLIVSLGTLNSSKYWHIIDNKDISMYLPFILQTFIGNVLGAFV